MVIARSTGTRGKHRVNISIQHKHLDMWSGGDGRSGGDGTTMVQVKHTDAVNSDTGIGQVCCWTSDRKTFLGPIAISESFRCLLCTVHGLSVRMYCTHV